MQVAPAPVGQRDALRVARRQLGGGERLRLAERAAAARERDPVAVALQADLLDPRDRHLVAVDGDRRALVFAEHLVGGADAADAAARARASCRTARSAGRACGSAWSRGACGRAPRCDCRPRSSGLATTSPPRVPCRTIVPSARSVERWPRAGSPRVPAQQRAAVGPGHEARRAVRKAAGGLASRGADQGGAAPAADAATSRVSELRGRRRALHWSTPARARSMRSI